MTLFFGCRKLSLDFVFVAFEIVKSKFDPFDSALNLLIIFSFIAIVFLPISIWYLSLKIYFPSIPLLFGNFKMGCERGGEGDCTFVQMSTEHMEASRQARRPGAGCEPPGVCWGYLWSSEPAVRSLNS